MFPKPSGTFTVAWPALPDSTGVEPVTSWMYDGAVMFAEPRFWLLVLLLSVSVNVCRVGVEHVGSGLAPSV